MEQTVASSLPTVLALVGLTLSLAADDAPSHTDPASRSTPAVEFVPGEVGRIALVATYRSGPELEEARLFLEHLIAEEMRDPAHIEPTRHQIRLVAAANAGSLSAAARLVDLGWWHGLRQVSYTRPCILAWKDDDQSIGQLHAGQVYAQVWIAHWRGSLDMHRTDSSSIRDQWLHQLQRWPIRHPLLLMDVARMQYAIEPRQTVSATACMDRALVECANDQLMAGDDLLVMEARGRAMKASMLFSSADDFQVCRAVLAGAAARCADRGFHAGEAVNLQALVEVRFDGSEPAVANARKDLAEVEALFAQAGDIARQGRCLGLMADLIRHQASAHQDADWDAVTSTYNDAADLCRRARDWQGYGAIITSKLVASSQRADRSTARQAENEAMLADMVHAYACADDAQEWANGLHVQAEFLSRFHGPGGDWSEIVAVCRAAETQFARGDEPDQGSTGPIHADVSACRLLNTLMLAEGLGMSDDAGAAHAMFVRTAVQLQGMEVQIPQGMRRRIHAGLRNTAP